MHIGFDVGGTKTEIIVIDKHGETHFSKRISTVHNYQSFIDCIIELTSEAEQAVNGACTVGLGIPGVVNPKNGLVKNANSTFLNGKPLQKDLSEKLQRTVQIANDANCFALSEAKDGAGASGSVVFGVILGTGCGGGIIVDKKIITGLNANAGEWGHNPLPCHSLEKDGDTPRCFCGRFHCLEQFISGTGFARQYNNIAQTQLKAPEIMDLVKQGDKYAARTYHLYIDQLARALAGIINILDPDTIVIGGGMSNINCIYEDVIKVIPLYTITPDIDINILKARFGDSSGIRGAAWLGKN
ncbi:ROK family protein [Sansalvadorimonas sp. 2012CJ34-2]|uniref:ROK family protein n=1 Tax=Parendozoicomonas callyspongiae TaxID=2942213 RepID=A0ABT0PHI2_9GAMM|nr:ROK family protein [Sansalvadorimonas sp. 2012CJ34-2]MCL6270790.1 ROK family protein [Sansalvadorimonas sp. 2012CJ34-2]